MRDKKLSSAWFTGVKTAEQKKKLQDHILSSSKDVVLMQLKSILSKRLQEIEDKELTTTQYDDPNWAYRNAHANGLKQQLKDTLDLLVFVS